MTQKHIPKKNINRKTIMIITNGISIKIIPMNKFN